MIIMSVLAFGFCECTHKNKTMHSSSPAYIIIRNQWQWHTHIEILHSFTLAWRCNHLVYIYSNMRSMWSLCDFVLPHSAVYVCAYIIIDIHCYIVMASNVVSSSSCFLFVNYSGCCATAIIMIIIAIVNNGIARDQSVHYNNNIMLLYASR